MSLEIMRDPRVRAVEWKDLVPVNRWEVFKELGICVPWITTSLVLAHFRLYLFALGFSFIFFLTGLRVVHNAYHYAIGIPRLATEWVMFILSVSMLSSMHALQITHLHHHKHCMDDEDVEAASARMSGVRAIVFGPLFPVMLHRKALELARPRQARWIYAELAVMATWVTLVLTVFHAPLLTYHVIAMLIGQCLTAFFAVWTVHHDCDREHFIARTLRSRAKSVIAFDMFFHVEHHLYPKVPTCHLYELSKRLDEAAPELQTMQVY